MKFLLKPNAPLLLSIFLLGGCSGLPSYRAVPQNGSHVTTLPSASLIKTFQTEVPAGTWWKQFNDVQLEVLVDLAWRESYDLRIAVARLSSASEQLKVSQSGLAPSVNLDAGTNHSRLAAIESRSGVPVVVSPLQAQISLAWELDLFGRVRHNINAAQANINQSAALRDEVRRVILAHVVEAYLDLRGAQRLQASLQEQVDNMSSSLALIREREILGISLSSDRLRIEAQLRLIKSRLPNLIAQERAARNRLATLTAQRLDAPQLVLLDTPGPILLPKTLMLDEPVQLLRHRPDVMAAEQALAVATAREGIAYADLFPRLSLSALVGTSGVAGNWLGSDTNRWRYGATSSWSLFDAGARHAQYRAAGSDVQAALANFDKVVATAMEEADTAISTWMQHRIRMDELTAVQALAVEGARLSRLRFNEGMDSLLITRETERNALVANEQLISGEIDFARSTTRFYFALAQGLEVVGVQRK